MFLFFSWSKLNCPYPFTHTHTHTQCETVHVQFLLLGVRHRTSKCAIYFYYFYVILLFLWYFCATSWVDVAQFCEGALVSINCVAHLDAKQLINNCDPIMSYIRLWKWNIWSCNLCTIKLELCFLDFNNYWNKSVLGHRAENHDQCLLYLFPVSLFFYEMSEKMVTLRTNRSTACCSCIVCALLHYSWK